MSDLSGKTTTRTTIALSLCLHVTLAIAWGLWPRPETPASKKKSVIQVSLKKVTSLKKTAPKPTENLSIVKQNPALKNFEKTAKITPKKKPEKKSDIEKKLIPAQQPPKATPKKKPKPKTTNIATLEPEKINLPAENDPTIDIQSTVPPRKTTSPTDISAIPKPPATEAHIETTAAQLSYQTMLRDWLEQHKTYPRRARLKAIEGEVLVTFVVDRNGKVISTILRKSSGYKTLDKAALATIKKASPLPAFPRELGLPKMTIDVPFGFYLSE